MNFMMDTIDILIRSISSIVFLFFITRLMGRKQISQLSFFDYVIGISIGSIAAGMALDQDTHYLHGFLAMLVYAIIAVAISVLTGKSIKFRRFVNGRSYYLIYKGKILDQNLIKVKYDVNDLLSEARFNGYFNIADIEYAVMEASGRVSFMPVAKKTPVVQEDINLEKPQEDLLANVIIDGKIMYDNLKTTGLDEIWLKAELAKQNFHKLEEIILATVDCDNNLSIYQKAEKLITKTFMD